MLLISSCNGAQTRQIYRLALGRAHVWPVLVLTAARHGPLGGILVFACMLACCANGWGHLGFWVHGGSSCKAVAHTMAIGFALSVAH